MDASDIIDLILILLWTVVLYANGLITGMLVAWRKQAGSTSEKGSSTKGHQD